MKQGVIGQRWSLLLALLLLLRLPLFVGPWSLGSGILGVGVLSLELVVLLLPVLVNIPSQDNMPLHHPRWHRIHASSAAMQPRPRNCDGDGEDCAVRVDNTFHDAVQHTHGGRLGGTSWD